MLLAAASAAIVLAEDIARLFTHRFTLVVAFPEALGLQPGADVRLAGQPIGTVRRVAFAPAGTEPAEDRAPVTASLELRAFAREFIRGDSEVRLHRPRLMGDPVVEIRPGTAAAPAVLPGDTLVGRAAARPLELVERVTHVRGALDTLSADARRIRHLVDDRAPITRDALDQLSTTAAEVDVLLAAFDHGPLADFLEGAEGREALARVVRRLHAIAALVRERAVALANEPPAAALERIAARVDELTAQLDELRALVDSPDGFRARWERDPALRQVLDAARVQLDSLVEVTRRRPWRFWF